MSTVKENKKDPEVRGGVESDRVQWNISRLMGEREARSEILNSHYFSSTEDFPHVADLRRSETDRYLFTSLPTYDMKLHFFSSQ